ncbi:uncharacterized protein LOC126373249 [Pectinophora gossypiella]|uniref:uncharacterized protein LOC126373249 n=1 Tax=Pectinophora gossypiella TaxID=13191 RepID=UPI00214DF814|nr:uncharacterized protein LOC126373249 [Pectinophora gossypiella]
MKTYLILTVALTQLHPVFNFPMQTSKLPKMADHINHMTETKRQQRNQNIPLSLPITHQFLVPSSLHVIPIQNVYQNKISVSHQNRTIGTQLFPIYSYIPVHHNYLVPVQDLAVIPLNHQSHPSHYHAVEKRREEEDVNRYRTFYGGYGTGLYFGGHGAGHGFYVYG